MTAVFAVCAVVGGTVLLCQLAMMLVGLAGDSFDVDVPHDVGHAVGGMGHDFGGDLHGDFHGDAGAAGGHAGADHHAGHAAGHHGTTWFFGVLSFRTVVAAITFFGLAGLAARSADMSMPQTLLVAVAAGLAAMYGVFWLLQSLFRLKAEGTVRIQGAVGRSGTVYIPVPGHKSGVGKIQLDLQNRTMEYQAVTSGDKLPTGARVVVTDIVTSDTLEVEPALEAERSSHA